MTLNNKREKVIPVSLKLISFIVKVNLIIFGEVNEGIPHCNYLLYGENKVKTLIAQLRDDTHFYMQRARITGK